MTEARRREGIWRYLSTRPNLMSEVLFIFPVLLFYHAGTHFTQQRSAVDIASALLAQLYVRVSWAPIAVDVLVVAAFIVLYSVARKREDFKIRMIGTVLAESAVYAFIMGTIIVLVLIYIFRIKPPSMGAAGVEGWFDVLYVSAGAGLHEELIFRLLLYGGMLSLLEKYTGLDRRQAVALSFVVSSLLFAFAHHIPPHGEPLALWPVAFRTLAGMVFASLYHLRGLSVAVYTHFLYDVYVIGLS
jgi:membrane protease YdiL (CAAX protease family)